MKHKKFLISLFLIIIFGSFLSTGIKYVLVEKGIISLAVSDNYKVYEKKKENNIIDKLDNLIESIKVKIDNVLINHFPFYFQINKLYQDINIKTDKLFLNDNDIPLGTDSSGEYIFFNQKYGFYYNRTQYNRKELDQRMLKMASFFNALSNKGIDLYLYLPSKYEMTKVPDYNLNDYYERFKDLLNDDIKVKEMEINTVEEYKKYFYLTDHHWNMKGSLVGYYEIMDMLKEKPIDDLIVFNHEEREFYGSYAKSMSSDLAFDYISDVTINLDYKVNINDSKFKPRQIRLDRENQKFYNYFVQFFNGQYDKIIYDFENNTKDNLLIMSDSYVWSIDYLIASSFNKTHVINLKYGDLKGNNFNLSDYIKENNISKVLFLYEAESIMFDQYNYDFEGRVK